MAFTLRWLSRTILRATSLGDTLRLIAKAAPNDSMAQCEHGASASAAPYIKMVFRFCHLKEVGGQAVLGRQVAPPTPWLTERHGYDPT